MRVLIVFFILLLFYLPGYAFDWKALNISSDSSPDSPLLLLTNVNGNQFYINKQDEASTESAKQIIELSDLFYNWQFINIKKLVFFTEGKSVRALIETESVRFSDRDLQKFIPSGMMFIKNEDSLLYKFRITDKSLFLRIEGNYTSETALLEEVIAALDNGKDYVKHYTPEYLRSKTEQFEKDIRILKDEVKSLRKTIISLNKKYFCLKSGCPDKLPNDEILTSTRYPKEWVLVAQQELDALGYSIYEVDGNWDYSTYTAVAKFQSRIPILKTTGELDKLTLVALKNKGIHKITAKDMLLGESLKLKQSVKNRLIVDTQIALVSQSAVDQKIDGVWNNNWLAGLILFQDINKIDVTGTLTDNTSAQLFKQPLKTKLDSLAKPDIQDKEFIKLVHEALFLKGYKVRFYDDNWRLASVIALANFQQDEQLTITGQLSPDTLDSLFDGKVQSYTKKVQQALKQQGYNPGEVDGLMGPLTQKAINTFQQDQGIKISGKIDTATKTRLFAQ